ncbi:hypothetical protein GCM10027570_42270 [Streptomonospora sediminis]
MTGPPPRGAHPAGGPPWWARRFTELLHRGGDAARMQRGRSLAAQGAVSGLKVRAGEAAMRVQGSRGSPYRVSIIVPVLSGDQWDTVARALAGQPLFRAALLAGDFPPELERVFDTLGLRLLPRGLGDLVLSCSCPDWGNPCKHAAAALCKLGEALGADPFLLVEWLGRPRGDLLADLRRHARPPATAEDGAAALAEPDPPGGPEPDPPHGAAGFWRAPALPPLPPAGGTRPAIAITDPPPPAEPSDGEPLDEPADDHDLAGLLAPLFARLSGPPSTAGRTDRTR